ncbi:MAG TPA: hypothetical protein VIE42_08540 [Steroidobacteraceae bacterium]|jgi:hypothetical protein
MNVASRPVTPGKTRACPHCKATILESLSICPGCLHHLRFDQEAAKRQVGATSALRVDGVIQHPTRDETWEYFVVISVRNERGEEVTRQVVGVGALQGAEKRTFSFAVEVLPQQAAVVVPSTPPKPGLTPPQAGSASPKPGLTPPKPGAPPPEPWLKR